jgi:hypothetical protein
MSNCAARGALSGKLDGGQAHALLPLPPRAINCGGRALVPNRGLISGTGSP